MADISATLALIEEVKQSGDEPPAGMALKPGTVTLDPFDPASVIVLVDGDDVATPCMSLIGGIQAGVRVQLLFFPPHGAYVIGQISATPWVEVSTFENSWENYDAAVYTVASYRRIGDVVSVRGLIKSGAAFQVPAFTLPAGYRPLRTHDWATDSNDAYGKIIVTPAGEVMPWIGNAAFFALDVIEFSVS